MKSKTLTPIIVMLFMISFVSANIQTVSLSPSSVDLCGDYSNYVTLSATGVTNQLNTTLTDVKAKLMIIGNSGLAHITNQEVNIGNIAPLSASTITPSWTIQCSNPNGGVYSAYIDYSTTNPLTATSLGQAESTIIVHQVEPLEVNVSVIEGQSTVVDDELPPVISDNTPTIDVDTNRDSICKGSLDHDEAFDDMDFIFFGTQKIHEYTFTSPLSEGLHEVYVKCKDSFDFTMQISTTIMFIVDTSNPEIEVVNPKSSITQDFVDFRIKTNEKSTCKYSDDDESFGNMISFEENNETYFSSTLTNLEVGDNKYYIKCRDIVGNEHSLDYTIEVELPPTAIISVDVEPPLKAGTYEVTVLPSKNLRSIPTLSYSFTDSPTFSRYVSLEKSGSNLYVGYMILEDYENDKIGVFSYSGVDINGIKGNEITDGATFLIDTSKPIEITSIEATSDVLGDITLRWFYDLEDVKEFNIYRSVSSNTDYIHYYTKTFDDIYIDDDVENGITYYYRVAPVDFAGNIGSLSRTVSALSTKKSSPNFIVEETEQNMDPPKFSTLKRYNDTLKIIERLLIDLDWAESNIKEKRTSEKIIDDLNLLKQIQDSTDDISKLKNQLNAINPNDETDKGLISTLGKAETIISTIEKTTPQKLDVTT
ncbi:hypothetical protein HN827_03390 [archaeon]|jgi:hypothetical protein|nr:hypothetical protein [archaeon]MBT4647765.1 hypothetical protein [archaeon]MBT6821626.1 hypothetical protein [archaeon]MBT7391846.1 hypothetical protein [archaeon]